MDEATLALLKPDESLGQYLSRSKKDKIESGVPVLDRCTAFHRSDVVELSGVVGSGKTEFLYSVAVSCILPRVANGVDFGGRGQHVIFLDLDYKFDIFRVSNLLQHRIQSTLRASRSAGSTKLNVEIVEIVTQTFERLHVFRCENSFQFLATLKSLSIDFLPTLYSEGGSLGAILVDDISSYWDVQKELKEYRRSASRRHSSSKEGTSTLESIRKTLEELQTLCQVPIFVTRRVPRAVRENPSYELNALWTDFTTKSASLGILGKQPSIAAPCRPSVRRISWVKPELHTEVNFVIEKGGGVQSCS
eukprot:jgi/Picre1/27833/NNA_000797.t1